MPKCGKCQKFFSKYVISEGKELNLSNRTRCYDCSPLNSKRKKREDSDKEGFCLICNKQFFYKRGKPGKNKCAACVLNKKAKEIKQRCLEYKGGKCIVCGYDKCPRALSFHHINEQDKKFQISGNRCRKWELIRDELDKCILVCNNCHSEIHAGLINLDDLGALPE